ncbi:MAG: Uma2 family endonuclease [Roseimicrobium sp.]
MTAAVHALIEPLLHSPLLPDIAERLNARMREETAQRRRFYEEMSDDEKAEFIEGEVVFHSPARNSYLLVRDNIQDLMRSFVRMHNLGVVHGEKCLCVFPRNDYEPDVIFFGPEKAARFTADTMKFPVPDLAVEVLSPNTEKRDRGVKFQDYEAHGVSEYWIVDADAETVEQYLLREGAFALELKSGTGEIASPTIPGFRIPIRAMFDAQENLAALQRIIRP